MIGAGATAAVEDGFKVTSTAVGAAQRGGGSLGSLVVPEPRGEMRRKVLRLGQIGLHWLYPWMRTVLHSWLCLS